MKEIAIQIAKETPNQKLNVLREYLQNYILFLMQKSGLNLHLYFLGGTALRFLYRIRRYSEDLDFSAGPSWNLSTLQEYSRKLEKDLIRANYSFTLRLKQEKTVQRIRIHFNHLLYEADLSPHENQKLPISLEIDTHPPSGWSGNKTIFEVHLPVLIQHLDPSSLFSAKLAAVLTRPYTKGRDVYDVFWFRSKWKSLSPNFTYLNNALAQKYENFIRVNESNWLNVFLKKFQALNWKTVKKDITPFLELKEELSAFTQENLLLLFSGNS